MIGPGDWVYRAVSIGPVLLGKVRDVYADSPGDSRINLYVYDREGRLIGRITEAEFGEPRGYEPHLPLSEFVKILEPQFPIPLENWEIHILRGSMFP